MNITLNSSELRLVAVPVRATDTVERHIVGGNYVHHVLTLPGCKIHKCLLSVTAVRICVELDPKPDAAIVRKKNDGTYCEVHLRRCHDRGFI